MRALVILCLVPGFSLGLVAGVTNIVGAPAPVSVQATNLVWSHRVFTTRMDFAAWLASRGSNYELWSKRHPIAAGHFQDLSRRSDTARSSVQPEAAGGSAAPHARSTKALLIASISLVVLLAMLALSRVARFARFLLEPPVISHRLRFPGPPSAVLAAVASRPLERARAHGRTHAPRTPRSASLGGAVQLDWREGWSGLCRLGRITADRAGRAATHNSRLVRHYLPRVAFYAVAVILSFAVGAWVAIYLK